MAHLPRETVFSLEENIIFYVKPTRKILYSKMNKYMTSFFEIKIQNFKESSCLLAVCWAMPTIHGMLSRFSHV